VDSKCGVLGSIPGGALYELEAYLSKPAVLSSSNTRYQFNNFRLELLDLRHCDTSGTVRHSYRRRVASLLLRLSNNVESRNEMRARID